MAPRRRTNQVTIQGINQPVANPELHQVRRRRRVNQAIAQEPSTNNPSISIIQRINSIVNHVTNQGWFSLPNGQRNIQKKRPIKRGKIIKKPQETKQSKIQFTRVFVKIRCPICFKTFGKEPAVSTACGHVFCKDCLETWLKDHNRCPVCSLSCRKKDHHTVYLEDMGDEESVTLPLEEKPLEQAVCKQIKFQQSVWDTRDEINI
ncbi:hypothetical protein O0L34_g6888 [Tuta absoluta]|nr:hypothetical protein O0L34_g6888 [Tuta absoluta]